MKTPLVIFALSIVALSGCVSSEEGTASFYVKDAPTDEFEEIHVVFNKIEVHQAGNESTWLTVYENSTGQDVDLLNASGNKAVFLGEADLAEGKYTQIRIYAEAAYGIQDGEKINFTMPNSVLKIVKSFHVTDGETRVIIDFDLDKSVKQAGGDWKMTPVVGKTFVHGVESEESGAEVHDEGETVEIEEL